MELLLQAIKKHLPGLNKVPYTFETVETICKRSHINLKICEYGPDILGYFCTRKTRKGVKKFIVINALLDDIDRTFIGIHEMVHAFLHVQISTREYLYFKRSAQCKNCKHDAEANLIAHIALIPLSLLLDLHGVAFSEIDPRLMPYLKRRQQIYEMYGI